MVKIEAVAHTAIGYFEKEVFLEISKISQEGTCARVSFLIKLQSCEFCKIPKNTLFAEHLRTTSVTTRLKKPWAYFSET